MQQQHQQGPGQGYQNGYQQPMIQGQPMQYQQQGMGQYQQYGQQQPVYGQQGIAQQQPPNYQQQVVVQQPVQLDHNGNIPNQQQKVDNKVNGGGIQIVKQGWMMKKG